MLDDIQNRKDDFNLLKDSIFRRQKMGTNILKITKVRIENGEPFYRQEWENIHFENCLFTGRIQLRNLRNIVFQNCQFTEANFQSYHMEKLSFINCETNGQTYILSGNTSKDVTFKGCSFLGPNAEPNYFGGIKLSGDISFKNCAGKYMNLAGEGHVTYQNCNFQDVDITCGLHSETPSKRRFADVHIEDCIFEKYTDMRASNLSKIVILNSSFDYVELENVVCKGDVVIENVKAGAFVAPLKEAKNIIIKNSSFSGAKKHVESQALHCWSHTPVRTVLIENIDVARDDSEYGTGLADGTVSTLIRNSSIARLNSNYMESAKVVIDGLQAEEAYFIESEIGQLTFRNTRISKKVDFTDVQVKEADLSGLERITGQQILTKGSNLKL